MAHSLDQKFPAKTILAVGLVEFCQCSLGVTGHQANIAVQREAFENGDFHKELKEFRQACLDSFESG